MIIRLLSGIIIHKLDMGDRNITNEIRNDTLFLQNFIPSFENSVDPDQLASGEAS